MNRKALIISNPGEPNAENYCKGVYLDVEQYVKYLMSPLGGSWYHDEILRAPRPTKKQVDDYIKQLRLYDYTIIIFTGHGYYSEDERTIIELKKGEDYDSSDLKRGTKKRLILLDSCRKIYHPPRVVFEDALIKAAVKAEKILDPVRCRKAFDIKVNECADDFIVGYSCIENEKSVCNNSKGSYYLSGLLREAKKWLENNKTDTSKFYTTLSIVSAHNGAEEFVIKESGGTQHPDIAKPKSGPYLPFAVIA